MTGESLCRWRPVGEAPTTSPLLKLVTPRLCPGLSPRWTLGRGERQQCLALSTSQFPHPASHSMNKN